VKKGGDAVKRATEDEPSEQMFAELAGRLVEAGDVLLPSVEAKVQDVRDVLKQAYSLLGRLELQVRRQQPKSAAVKRS
jgi:hypothetical protein